MRVFKTRGFARFARAEGIADADLVAAVKAAERGLVDADLGRGLIKLRIARPGGGKSGGFRTLIAYRSGRHAVFIYGFAKSARGNVKPDELADLRDAASEMVAWSDAEIAGHLRADRLQEVAYE